MNHRTQATCNRNITECMDHCRICTAERTQHVPLFVSLHEVRSQVRLFADDTALYLTMESEDDSSALQNDLDILSAWESRWDMEFNSFKCQVVHVTGSKGQVNMTNYVLHGQVLESVTSARYLGVDISSNLSWKTHVDRITGNVDY